MPRPPHDNHLLARRVCAECTSRSNCGRQPGSDETSVFELLEGFFDKIQTGEERVLP